MREPSTREALLELDAIIAALATPGYLGEAERARLAGRLTAARQTLERLDAAASERSDA